MLRKIIIALSSISLCLLVFFLPISRESADRGQDFLLSKYDEVAIATDLEPDDLLALGILFEAANGQYEQSGRHKYPIDFLLVGEGDVEKKCLQMQRCLDDYFSIPEGVSLRVVGGGDGAMALKDWAASAKQPFIIQLKPLQELCSFDAETAKKTTLLIYGGYNIRQTVKYLEGEKEKKLRFMERAGFSRQLEGLISYLQSMFYKVAILETYGTLGAQSCVCADCRWTGKIAESIIHSHDPFIEMFYAFSIRRNHEIMEDMLLFPPHEAAYQGLRSRIAHSTVQFTLADVLVAIATTDKESLFTVSPIRATYDENGFLIPLPDRRSNLFYYQKTDHSKIAARLEAFLEKREMGAISILHAAAS
jgi:hypothetical protein